MLMLEIFFWMSAFLILISGLVGLGGPEPYRIYGTRGFCILLFIMVLILGYTIFDSHYVSSERTTVQRVN